MTFSNLLIKLLVRTFLEKATGPSQPKMKQSSAVKHRRVYFCFECIFPLSKITNLQCILISRNQAQMCLDPSPKTPKHFCQESLAKQASQLLTTSLTFHSQMVKSGQVIDVRTSRLSTPHMSNGRDIQDFIELT